MPVAKRSITIDDLWARKRLGTGSLSHNGTWTCATLTSHDMKKDEASTKRQLTRGKHDSDLQWSPEGKWNAFVSKRGEGKDADEAGQLYIIPADGGKARRVCNVATGVSALRWFPDSKRMAFVSWVWPELKTHAEQEKCTKAEKDDKVRATVVEHNHYRYWDHWFARGRKPHIHVVDIATGKYDNLFVRTAFHLPFQEPDAALLPVGQWLYRPTTHGGRGRQLWRLYGGLHERQCCGQALPGLRVQCWML